MKWESRPGDPGRLSIRQTQNSEPEFEILSSNYRRPTFTVTWNVPWLSLKPSSLMPRKSGPLAGVVHCRPVADRERRVADAADERAGGIRGIAARGARRPLLRAVD